MGCRVVSIPIPYVILAGFYISGLLPLQRCQVPAAPGARKLPAPCPPFSSPLPSLWIPCQAIREPKSALVQRKVEAPTAEPVVSEQWCLPRRPATGSSTSLELRPHPQVSPARVG